MANKPNGKTNDNKFCYNYIIPNLSRFYAFLSNRKFLNFLLDKKSTYRSEVQRNDSHDSDFFIT